MLHKIACLLHCPLCLDSTNTVKHNFVTIFQIQWELSSWKLTKPDNRRHKIFPTQSPWVMYISTNVNRFPQLSIGTEPYLVLLVAWLLALVQDRPVSFHPSSYYQCDGQYQQSFRVHCKLQEITCLATPKLTAWATKSEAQRQHEHMAQVLTWWISTPYMKSL